MSEFIKSNVGWIKLDERLPPTCADDLAYEFSSPAILFKLQDCSVCLGRAVRYADQLYTKENIRWTESGRDAYTHDSAAVIGWAYATPTTIPFTLPFTLPLTLPFTLPGTND